MRFRGLRKTETDLHTISIQKNGGKAPIQYVEGLQPSELPTEYQKTKVEMDTDAIRQALEAGELLDFAVLLEKGESLRIK